MVSGHFSRRDVPRQMATSPFGSLGIVLPRWHHVIGKLQPPIYGIKGKTLKIY